MIPLDEALRPTFLFPQTVHEGCDRGGYYEQADFAADYSSLQCIVKLGCWGPVVLCNAAGVIEGAIDASQLAADAKRIHLVRVWDRSAAIVAGDGNRLLQVVNNLLTNAVKFTPPEGRVEVRLEREGGIARISVIDNGCTAGPCAPTVRDPGAGPRSR